MNTTTAYSTKDEYAPKRGDVFHKIGDASELYIISFVIDSKITIADQDAIRAVCLNTGEMRLLSFNQLKKNHTIYRDVAISIEGDEV